MTHHPDTEQARKVLARIEADIQASETTLRRMTTHGRDHFAGVLSQLHDSLTDANLDAYTAQAKALNGIPAQGVTVSKQATARAARLKHQR